MRALNGRRLGLQLLAAGRRASITAEGGRVRLWSLCLSVCLFILAACSLVLAEATYDGRDIRGAARSPIPVSRSSEHAVALWAPDTDDVDGTQHFLAYVEPLTDDAPLPPGLEEWPKPGEAVLSQSLATAGAKEEIISRYGRFAGIISPEGLQSPSERFAYVRPSQHMLDSGDMYKISGFGKQQDIYWGESRSLPSLGMLCAGLIGFLLLPASALLIAAIRTGSSARERRVILLDILGAGPSAKILFVIGECSVPLLVGCSFSLAFMAPALKWNIPLPVVDFVLYAPDVADSLWQLIGALLLSVVAVILLVLGSTPGIKKSRFSDLRSRLHGHTRWWPWVFPLFFLLAVRGPGLANEEWRLPVYVIGALGALSSLPSVVGLAVARGGALVAQAGKKAGSPGMIFSGRRAAMQSRSTARFVAALMAAIFLVVQAQLWMGLLGANATLARKSQDRVGTSIVTVSHHGDDDSRIGDFAQALPSEAEIAMLQASTPSPGATRAFTIHGSCAALRALSAPCQSASVAVQHLDERIIELLRWNEVENSSSIKIEPGPVTADGNSSNGNGRLFVFSRSGDDLPLPQLREAARRTLAMMANVEPLANTWAMGAQDLVSSGQWILLLGVAGVALTVIAVGLSSLGEFIRFGREASPLIAIAGKTRVYASVAFWSLFIPSVLASIVGAIASAWLTTPIIAGLNNPISTGLYITLCAAGILASSFLCLCGWRIMTRMALSWRAQGEF
ncbi:hypothetical protein [Streptomyces sp. WAC04114]|uniref:hypothetical protein n=1 Tax=Streptomyces sp. WAC04114 TaxID=2867961 RepID=UPI001C8CE660|nr:hypothetical protein [Streptomyces sp. WAC04114]MBX9365661.1 hypothetical protein [Streptomyces sp. WAC04114]